MSKKRNQPNSEILGRLSPADQFFAACHGKLWIDSPEAVLLATGMIDPKTLVERFQEALKSRDGSFLPQLADAIDCCDMDTVHDPLRVYIVNYFCWKMGARVYAMRKPIQTNVTLRELSDAIHKVFPNPPDLSDLLKMCKNLGYLPRRVRDSRK